MRPLALYVLVVLAAACSKTSTPTGIPDPSVDSAAATAAAPVSASAAPPASPTATAPQVQAIAVRGYPHSIRNGMNDPAYRVGWTKDGALFGYCADLGGRDPQVTRCEFVDAAGKVTTMTSESNNDFDRKKKKAIDAFLRERAIPEIARGPDPETKPAPLSGTWSFGDITLDVARPPAPEGKPVVVKVGGAVGAEAAVYPITLSSHPVPAAPPHFAVMNGMAVSPDGKDLGMVGHFFACEYCDSFAVKRVPLASLASSIYNETGFRHHQKGDYVKAAPLFEKAAAADEAAKLPPYNLACALAQLGDPRARDALASAIKIDPTAKSRAQKDKDFDKVRSEPWFGDLVR